MATLQVRIENGFFVGNNGCYVHSFEPTHVVGNGWNCIIEEDGTIKCESVREYSDGEHSMRYIIQPNGFAKLTLKVPYAKVRTLRKGFVISKGCRLSDGLLGLAGGYIDERYAYFRDSTFQKFLEEHGISAVKHENPNKTFVVRNALYGGGECYSYLLTDGTIYEESYDSGRTESWEKNYPGTGAYEGNEYLKVTGATWVIHKQVQHEGDSHNCFCLLYTMEKDLTKLVIPNPREKEGKLSKLREIEKKGFLSLEELGKSLLEIIPNLKGKIEYKDPEYIEVICYNYHSGMLETNDNRSIKFSSISNAVLAFDKLKGIKFENPEMLEKYLLKHGFKDASFAKYYACVFTNAERTTAFIAVRLSTSNGKGFDGDCKDFLTAEI